MNPVERDIRGYFGIAPEDSILEHYGTKRHSGRYPWGSGENPYQRSGDFLSRVEELKKSGMKLNEELGMAFLIGDGRDDASDDKINELNIRPIFNDDDFYTIKVVVQPGTNANEDAKAKATIKSIIKARKEYKGSGSPTFYTTDDVLTDMLLLEDGIGHPLYADEAALARKLRVKEIVTVPRMEGRKGAKGGDLLGIVVNLADYTVGADKGGEVNMFDDFNIDYNQLIYLIETRCSGAMTTPYGAMAIEMDAANSSKV